MKKLMVFLTTVIMVISFNTICFADALTDWQAAQAQVAALTAQVQQLAILAQTDPTQISLLQALQAQLAQAQQNAAILQPAAAQILQAQQAQALQTQQIQAQQAATLQAQQMQAQQVAALQAQQMQAQQAAAMQAQQAQALRTQQAAKSSTVAPVQTASSRSGDIVYIPATGDGEKYHRKDCRTIKHGVVAVTRAEAKAMGRSACGVCHPD